MTPFERFAPAIALFFGLFGVAVPLMFAAVVIQGGSPVTPAQYGEMVYAIPALVWASLQFTFGAAACLAAVQRAPRITALFAAMFTGLMIFFAAAAIIAGPTGTLVVAGTGAGVAPLAGIAAIVCWWGRHGK